MIALAAADTIAGISTSATTVNCTIFGDQIASAADAYQCLYQGQLPSSATTLYTSPGSTATLISNIHLFNTGTTVQTVTLYRGGTGSSNQIASFQIPPSGTAVYEAGVGWQVYSQGGLLYGTSVGPGGQGTSPTSMQSLTASSANLVLGSSIALITNALSVGSRYRFIVNLVKTAAGTNTWTAALKWGTANTTADAAVATWTSGTNTAALDAGILIIEATVTTLGGSAAFNCLGMWAGAGTWGAGLGGVGASSPGTAIPGSTATFTSTLTSPFLHVDVTPGASAVMTAVASAERLV